MFFIKLTTFICPLHVQVSDESQRATAAQVAHVENEVEVRAANIVSGYNVPYCWSISRTRA